jgi:hypothetical protein
MRRSTVLRLPPQLVFPSSTVSSRRGHSSVILNLPPLSLLSSILSNPLDIFVSYFCGLYYKRFTIITYDHKVYSKLLRQLLMTLES